MSGQAEKDHQLKIGDRCILEVSEGNYPQGFWWGRVTKVGTDAWSVQAVIDGGAFHLSSEMGRHSDPIYSNEHEGLEPSVNYWVFPDTRSVRGLLNRLLKAQESLEVSRCRFRLLREDTAEVLRQALRVVQAPATEQSKTTETKSS
jgi:hypothetical protein